MALPVIIVVKECLSSTQKLELHNVDRPTASLGSVEGEVYFLFIGSIQSAANVAR